MKKTFRKYFIPHIENDHKPHFLRETSLFWVSLLILFLFGLSLLGNYLVTSNKYLASIQSAFLVDLANEDRVSSGLTKLSINDKLIEAASLKAYDMSEKSYFAHVSPEGVTPWYWIERVGYNYVFAGENLAVNFYDSEDVQDAWMDSPTHRANILSKNFTEIGIATARGKYKGENTTFVVQMFGSPKKVANVSNNTQEAQTIVLEEETNLNNESQVLGTEIEVKASSAEDSSFMTFTNPDVTQEELNSLPKENSNNEETTYTNWFERMIVSPSSVVGALYTAIMAVIVFSLILKIFIEIRKQHPKNIAYGVFMLALVLFFMHLNSQGIAEPTIVVSL